MHVHFERIACHVLVPAIQGLLQGIAREDAARLLDQRAQQSEFAPRQVDDATFPVHGERGRIKPQVALAEHRLGLPLGTPVQRAQAGQVLVRVEGLAEEIIGPEVEGLDAVFHAVAGGEHKDGHGHAGSPCRTDDVQAIEARQTEVEHGRIETAITQRRQGRHAIGDPIHREGRAPQGDLQALAQRGVVFNQQDAHAASLGLSPPASRARPRFRHDDRRQRFRDPDARVPPAPCGTR